MPNRSVSQKRLDFPFLYLELTVINALAGAYGTLSGNVWTVFQYLADRFPNAHGHRSRQHEQHYFRRPDRR